jgi:hypothetical protein
MYICPDCGKFHLITPAICECGHVFKKGSVKCKECGTPITPEQEYCPYCKKSVWDMFVFVCPKCSERIYKGQKVCRKCGFVLIRESRKVEFITQTKYICPRCGYELPTINTPCPICEK